MCQPQPLEHNPVLSLHQLGLSCVPSVAGSHDYSGHVIADCSCRRGNAVAMTADNGRLLTGGLSLSNKLVNAECLTGCWEGQSEWMLGNNIAFKGICVSETSLKKINYWKCSAQKCWLKTTWVLSPWPISVVWQYLNLIWVLFSTWKL